MKFCELPIGTRFRFMGKVYTKIALSMAQDANREATVFGRDGFDEPPGQHEVELIEEQPENPS